MRTDRIEIGDAVIVDFQNGSRLRGVVDYAPTETGENAWIILGNPGIVTYVKQ